MDPTVEKKTGGKSRPSDLGRSEDRKRRSKSKNRRIDPKK